MTTYPHLAFAYFKGAKPLTSILDLWGHTSCRSGNQTEYSLAISRKSKSCQARVLIDLIEFSCISFKLLSELYAFGWFLVNMCGVCGMWLDWWEW